jgi:hypothetical protein
MCCHELKYAHHHGIAVEVPNDPMVRKQLENSLLRRSLGETKGTTENPDKTRTSQLVYFAAATTICYHRQTIPGRILVPRASNRFGPTAAAPQRAQRKGGTKFCHDVVFQRRKRFSHELFHPLPYTVADCDPPS